MLHELYALPLAFLFISPFLPFGQGLAMTICIYLLIKWLSDYRKCTISYLECKVRGVKKEDGYINRYIDPVIDLNQSEYRYFIYLFIIVITLGNYNRPFKP